MYPCPNLRAGLALAGAGPSVCPLGPGSHAASTPQHCAWQMQKVSTKAVVTTTGHHTAISQNLSVAITIRQTHSFTKLLKDSPHISCFFKWKAIIASK